MKKVIWKELNQSEKLSVLQRPTQKKEANVLDTVKDILEKVKNKGDLALFELTEKYDGVKIDNFKVTKDEIIRASKLLSAELKNAINVAFNNIKNFHQVQYPVNVEKETMSGVLCGKYWVPLNSVGLYVPGGKAPLVSSVLMMGAPSYIANNAVRILCTPPQKNGEINPAILYAAELCGIENVFKIGGAQAIAAMAYGTNTIPKVDKIFGPGNSYVTAAKMLCNVSIDVPAGPSEILVVADKKSNISFIIEDLLSQLEHGDDSHVILVSDSKEVIDLVAFGIEKNVNENILKNCVFIQSENIDEAICISNIYAPEHLSLQTENAMSYVQKVVNAGSVFVGKWSPVAAGDYASGTNHVLPTCGYARNYSGLSTLNFMKSITFQNLSYEGLSNLADSVISIANVEGLISHKKSIEVRLKK